MIDELANLFADELPSELVERLLSCYIEMREAFNLGKLRPSELEAGRFSEVVFRILEAKTDPGGGYTPLTVPLPSVDALTRRLENLDPIGVHDSIRLHIPRVMRSIYNIRNRRDVGHVSGDVSPNVADATLLITNSNWVMAELVRLYFKCELDEAQVIVDALVEKRVPIVQDFNGHLKTLNPNLTIRQRLLVLLYHRGETGATRAELGSWLKGKASSTISTELSRLEASDLIHKDGSHCLITRRGIAFAEANIRFESELSNAPAKERRKRTHTAKRK